MSHIICFAQIYQKIRYDKGNVDDIVKCISSGNYDINNTKKFYTIKQDISLTYNKEFSNDVCSLYKKNENVLIFMKDK